MYLRIIHFNEVKELSWVEYFIQLQLSFYLGASQLNCCHSEHRNWLLKGVIVSWAGTSLSSYILYYLTLYFKDVWFCFKLKKNFLRCTLRWMTFYRKTTDFEGPPWILRRAKSFFDVFDCLFTSDHHILHSLLKVRRPTIGCINHDIVVSLCFELVLSKQIRYSIFENRKFSIRYDINFFLSR